MTAEPMDIRRKRLRMRSMRRGIREMDLILMAFAARDLDAMTGADLDLYETLLEENDHDIYAWINGQTTAPDPYAGMISRIAAMATGVARPD